MYNVIRTVKEDKFSALGLDPCLLEDELDKVRGQAVLPSTRRDPKWAMGDWSLSKSLGNPIESHWSV